MEASFIAGLFWGLGIGATITTAVAIFFWFEDRLCKIEKNKKS